MDKARTGICFICDLLFRTSDRDIAYFRMLLRRVLLFALLVASRLTFAQAPAVTSIVPSSAVPGTQVTVTGVNFGATQGSGSILLGSKNGVVVSWSNTQIVATVATGA